MAPQSGSPFHFEPEIIEFGDNSRPSFYDKDEIIAALEKEIRRLKGLADLDIPQASVDALLPIGSTVWAIKRYGRYRFEALDGVITEYTVHDGKLCVVLGFHHVPYDEVFKTKAEAEAYERSR